MKSRRVDWSKENIYEEWEFTGGSLMQQKAEEEKKKNPKADVYQDNIPMMNYAYEIHRTEIDNETIIKVCEETNCTIVYNTEEDIYYLALTGGGMDLSQDIALAYIIVDGCIDWDLLEEVPLYPLSKRGENLKRILKELERQVSIKADQYKNKLKEIKKAIKNLKE